MLIVAQSAVAKASDSRLREPGLESCAAMSNVFTLYCSNSLSCMNISLAIDSGAYLFTKSLCTLIAMRLDDSQRNRDSLQFKMFARE